MLDVPNTMGKAGEQVRAQLGAPRHVDSVRPNSLDAIPGGGWAWSYCPNPTTCFDLLLDRSQRVAGVLVHALDPPAIGYEQALIMMGLPTDQRPSRTAPAAQYWNNLSGYYVGMTQDPRDRHISPIVIRAARA